MFSINVTEQFFIGREYLLLGFEDIENQRLLHLSNSIALEWHKQHAEKILVWVPYCTVSFR
jgi:hypothetical protein